MRAILLAAGFGTRLRPLTDNIPKCLVPIRGEPLLNIWLDKLVRTDLLPVLINTHYLPQQIASFVESSSHRDYVTLVYEPELLGTAGTLRANLDFYQGQDGLLIHSDNLCQQNLRDLVFAHHQRPPECLLTMLTFRADTPSACGIVEIDTRGVVVGYHEKITTPPGNLANGAVYILSAEFINQFLLNFETPKDFSADVLPLLIGRIYTFITSELFLDVGTPNAYARANSEWRSSFAQCSA